jgi:hypothetical protein
MEKTNMDAYLQETILDCIDRAMTDRTINMHDPFNRVLEAQEHIGWVNMLCGYWSQEWQVGYKKFYDIPLNQNTERQEPMLTSNGVLAKEACSNGMGVNDKALENKEQ